MQPQRRERKDLRNVCLLIAHTHTDIPQLVQSGECVRVPLEFVRLLLLVIIGFWRL